MIFFSTKIYIPAKNCVHVRACVGVCVCAGLTWVVGGWLETSLGQLLAADTLGKQYQHKNQIIRFFLPSSLIQSWSVC